MGRPRIGSIVLWRGQRGRVEGTLTGVRGNPTVVRCRLLSGSVVYVPIRELVRGESDESAD